MEELGKESTVLPNLKKALAHTETAIDNMLYAIQSGIITPSTKQRLEELEGRKSSIETMIIQEKMTKPVIGHDMFVSWLTHFREYNTSDKEQRQRLVDHFVNVIYLYDDRMDIFLNFRDGAVSIQFDAKMWKAGKKRNPDEKKFGFDIVGFTNNRTECQKALRSVIGGPCAGTGAASRRKRRLAWVRIRRRSAEWVPCSLRQIRVANLKGRRKTFR